MFDKGLLLFFGVIALVNIFLFVLLIFYSSTLFISIHHKFLELQGIF